MCRSPCGLYPLRFRSDYQNCGPRTLGGSLPRVGSMRVAGPLPHPPAYISPFLSTTSLFPSLLDQVTLHLHMPPTDRSPLLGNGLGFNGHSRRPSFKDRIVRLFKVPRDRPGLIQSYKYFFFGSWFNILLVFVPLSFVSHHLNWDAALRFSFSLLAIMSLAKVK